MAPLAERLRSDLTAAMKARDELRAATLRLALTAVVTEQVAGKSARELSEEEVVAVLRREAKKRREAAEAYDGAGRGELASRERDELGVLETYLPAQLSDEDLTALVGVAIKESGAPAGPPGAALGRVMKLVTPRVAGRADGARVAAEVRRQLSPS
jgi:uncharacterized protein YqeY